ncbi:hypothetical protein ES703_49602 [subsurface metagenome]
MGKMSTRWFRSGPLDVEILRSGVLLSAHRTRHEPEGADEVRGIDLLNLPTVNNTGWGIETTDTVGEDFDPSEIGYMGIDGKYYLSDADSAAQMPAKVMAMESISADAAGRLLHIGYYRHDAWTWAWVAGEGNLLFADTTPGAMVQFAAKPAAVGDQVQVVGYVVTEDIAFFNPSYELVEIA